MNKGFTLIEILVYIAVLAILILAIGSFLIWIIRLNAKTEVMRGTLEDAKLAMDFMLREVEEANAVYIPTSIFGSHPGQLSLNTPNYLPADEQNSYIDFYLCGTQFCFKKEGQGPIALTSENTEITNLVFTQVVNGEMSSVKIDMTVSYKNPNNRVEYRSEINLSSSAALRAE
jgi:prepilin-type N-terminal cleavage/methylation domain-containing protein